MPNLLDARLLTARIWPWGETAKKRDKESRKKIGNNKNQENHQWLIRVASTILLPQQNPRMVLSTQGEWCTFYLSNVANILHAIHHIPAIPCRGWKAGTSVTIETPLLLEEEKQNGGRSPLASFLLAELFQKLGRCSTLACTNLTIIGRCWPVQAEVLVDLLQETHKDIEVLRLKFVDIKEPELLVTKIGQLTKLKRLTLEYCVFKVNLATFLKAIDGLEKIFLDSCTFTENPKELGCWKTLQWRETVICRKKNISKLYQFLRHDPMSILSFPCAVI